MHQSNISRTLHKTGLHEKVVRKKPLIMKNLIKAPQELAGSMSMTQLRFGTILDCQLDMEWLNNTEINA